MLLVLAHAAATAVPAHDAAHVPAAAVTAAAVRAVVVAMMSNTRRMTDHDDEHILSSPCYTCNSADRHS